MKNLNLAAIVVRLKKSARLLVSWVVLFSLIAMQIGPMRVQPVAAQETVTVPERVFGLGNVRSVTFSPDGEKALLGSNAGFAVLVDLDTGAFGTYFLGHTGEVYSVAFSPDGTQVLTGSYDGAAKLWDAATGDESNTFSDHAGSVSSVAFSPDGTRVLTGSDGWTAKL